MTAELTALVIVVRQAYELIVWRRTGHQQRCGMVCGAGRLVEIARQDRAASGRASNIKLLSFFNARYIGRNVILFSCLWCSIVFLYDH